LEVFSRVDPDPNLTAFSRDDGDQNLVIFSLVGFCQNSVEVNQACLNWDLAEAALAQIWTYSAETA